LPHFDHEEINQFKSDVENKKVDGESDIQEMVEFHVESDEEVDNDSALESIFAVKKKPVEEKKVTEGLNISIVKFETIKYGFMGLQSYTQYQIVTIANNIALLESDDEYKVWRRFSDFEWLHNAILKQDEHKGLVLPILPEKSMLSKNDETFCESRRASLQAYLKALSEHKITKNSRTLHLFLSMTNDSEFTTLKASDDTLQSRLFEYAQMIKNFDMDRLAANFSQYFDSEEPDKFMLASPIKAHIQSLLDYEKVLHKMIDAIDARYKVNTQIRTHMSQIALGLEKLRLNSESNHLEKLFSTGNNNCDDDIENLDDVGLSKINSKESDNTSDEYDKIDRLTFMKSIFPSLKQETKADKDLRKSWNQFYEVLRIHLSKINGLKTTLDSRSAIIAQYKTNLGVVKRKRYKQEPAYHLDAIIAEIDAIESENKELETKILKINLDLSSDLEEVNLQDNIHTALTEFMDKHKKVVDSQLVHSNADM
jgi:hypothetical protein